MIDKVVQDFCDYYRTKPKKVVHYWYDHTAISKDGRSLSYKEMVINTLRANKWEVIEHYTGQTPKAESRYKLWAFAFRGDFPDLPHPTFNRRNCKYLILAMQLTGVVQTRYGFAKDKRPERKLKVPQEEAPHLTDAADLPFYSRFYSRLREDAHQFVDNFMG